MSPYQETDCPRPTEPLIPPDSLRLPNGDYPNKHSLLQILSGAGLPVKRIVSPHEIRNQLEVNASNYEAQVDLPSWYLRGFDPRPLDSWAVDMLPTWEIYVPDDIFDFERKLAQVNTPDVQNFLRQNFGLPGGIPDPRYFIQESVPSPEHSSIEYISVLTHGPLFFMAVRSGDSISGGMYYGNPKHYFRLDLLDDEHIFPLLNQSNHAQQVLDSQLHGSYEYKFDLLPGDIGGNTEYYFIQARVCRPKLTIGEIRRQAAIISDKSRQITVVTKEIGDLDTSSLPNRPFILRLSNEKHMGKLTPDGFKKLNLSKMAGLILPGTDTGSLLEHGGYGFLAYAYYWGLPIAFDRLQILDFI